MSTTTGVFVRKPVTAGDEDSGLKKAVGALDLTALGLGAVIGTGIFVIIGEAIGISGPALILSFVLAGVTCAFSAMSYSELAAAMPASGSAYSYSYATLGEIVAWIIGWDLLLEYGISVAAVAVGWGGYLQTLLESLIGLSLPDAIAAPPGKGGTFNLPAVVLVAGVAALLCVGVRESARTNSIMVGVKVLILIMFCVIGVTAIDADNFSPFAPDGANGVVDAAALIFFAYIGFDAISTSGEESKRPQRDMPLAIIGALAIATLIYVCVALVATGLAPAKTLAGSDAPLADALKAGGFGSWATNIVSFGALIAITSVVLTVFYGQTRITFAMCRDGLLPARFATLSSRSTPVKITVFSGVLMSILAALLPLSELAKLVNIGTLFAFLLVNVGVIVLRRTDPGMERPFRVPLSPAFPFIGAALCIYLMTKQPAETWLRFGVWMAIGLAIYFFYGRSHSKARAGAAAEAA